MDDIFKRYLCYHNGLFLEVCKIPWRNGSASDSRSEGRVFESRRGQSKYFYKQLYHRNFILMALITITNILSTFHSFGECVATKKDQYFIKFIKFTNFECDLWSGVITCFINSFLCCMGLIGLWSICFIHYMWCAFKIRENTCNRKIPWQSKCL